MGKKRFVAVCCLCGKGVRTHGVDPISVALFSQGAKEDVEQTFFAHIKCFREALHPTIFPDLREELGGPKIDWSKLRVIRGPLGGLPKGRSR